MILHNAHVIFLRTHFLLYTYLSLISSSFLLSIKLCESQFIDNGLQTSESIVNK